MKEQKCIVALGRYNKRKNKNKPLQEDLPENLEHMSTEDRELYELRQLICATKDIINKLPETGREKFRNYEYKKYDRKLNLSNIVITRWLEHPSPKYTRYIIRMRCKHGIRCRGTRALTTTKPCLALHPCE
jgi:hypothetical protein